VDVVPRLTEEQKRRPSQQALVAHLGEYALVEQDLSAVMRRAVSIVVEGLQVEYCELLELLPDQRHLLLREGVGWRDGVVGRMTVGTGLGSQAGYTLRCDAPIVVDDLRSEERFQPPRLLIDHEAVSGVTCVIRSARGKAYGVLGAHTRQRRMFNVEDVDFLQSVASLVGSATERKRMEEALRESEERFRMMADAAPVMIWLAGTDRFRTYFSKGWLDFTGRALDQELGDGWTVGIHPEDHERYVLSYTSTFNAGEPFELEYRLRRHDGEYRWIVDRGEALLDRDGAFTGYIGSCIDIDERKEAEQAVHDAAARLAAIVDTAVDGILTIDERGQIDSVNPAVTRIFGYLPEEMLGRNVRMLMPEPYRSEHDEYLSRYLDTDEKRIIGIGREVEGQRKDGSTFPLELTVSETLLDGRRVFTGLVRDVTDRKEAERNLRESEARLSLALLAGRMGVWEWDIETGEARWSPMLEQIHGLQPGTFGGTFGDFERGVHGDDRGRVLQTMRQALDGGDYHVEYRIVRPDGEVLWVEARGRVFRDGEGRPRRMVGVCMDITQRKRVEAELRQLNITLEQRVANRTARLERQSNQLRHLATELVHAEQRERHRLAELIHDHLQQLLTAARLRLLAARGKAEDRELDELLSEVADILRESIDSARSLTAELQPPVLYAEGLVPALRWLADWVGERYELEVDLRLDESARADDERIRTLVFQSARELLFNVVKHSGVRHVALELAADRADRIRLTVEDRGTGFDPHVVDGEDRTLNGFGLFSIRERLKALGGNLQIRSRPGSGTRIDLSIPVRVETNPSEVE
jgi:PAS domain S-box-containing protein